MHVLAVQNLYTIDAADYMVSVPSHGAVIGAWLGAEIS